MLKDEYGHVVQYTDFGKYVRPKRPIRSVQDGQAPMGDCRRKWMIVGGWLEAGFPAILSFLWRAHRSRSRNYDVLAHRWYNYSVTDIFEL